MSMFSVNIHLNNDENAKIEAKETFLHHKSLNKTSHYMKIHIGKDTAIFASFEQAKQIRDVLDKELKKMEGINNDNG